MTFLSVAVLGLSMGCVAKKDVEHLQAQIDQINGRITQMETRSAMQNALSGDPSTPGADAEEIARQQYQRGVEAYEGRRIDEAREIFTRISERYGQTSSGRDARRLLKELELIGSNAGMIDSEMWFQGFVDISIGSYVMVFFETWCPHCRREMPSLQENYTMFSSRGVEVVGLTKLTRSSTEEAVRDFIVEHGLAYPIVKEGGEISTRLNVSGIPAAAIVRDGIVLWRGHPAKINEDLLDSLQ